MSVTALSKAYARSRRLRFPPERLALADSRFSTCLLGKRLGVALLRDLQIPVGNGLTMCDFRSLLGKVTMLEAPLSSHHRPSQQHHEHRDE
jgi:hypothetical protein